MKLNSIVKKNTLRFGKENEMQKVIFSTEKKYFTTSMKSFVKLDDDIKNWKDYMKIQELPDLCGNIIEKDDGIHLNGIKYISDTQWWKEVEKPLKSVKIKRKYHTIEYEFCNKVEKN